MQRKIKLHVVLKPDTIASGVFNGDTDFLYIWNDIL